MSVIKEKIKACDFDAALDLLDEALKLEENISDFDFLYNHAVILKEVPSDYFLRRGFLVKRIAILGGFNTSYISALLKLDLYQKGIFLIIYEASYATMEALIYSKDSELSNFSPELCYLCVGTPHVNLSDLSQHGLEKEAKRWEMLLHCLNEWLNCQIIMNNFIKPIERVYGNFELRVNSKGAFISNLNRTLLKYCPSYVHISDMEYSASVFGKLNWLDWKLYDLAKMPVAIPYMIHYVDVISRIASSIWGKSKKCLILDLDNTLWGGVIGDDGLSGILIGEGSSLGEAYKRFQSYVKELKSRGVILAICSKNDEINAREPFENLADMVLKIDDFSAFYANWLPKYQNIIAIAKNLNIGLDSIVFADDNPVERDIVRSHLPAVKVIELPENPSFYTTAIDQSGYFEVVSLTDDDLKRSSQYLDNFKRDQLKMQFSDYEEYLSSLRMKALISEFDEKNLARVTQLINKTNQFNLTLKRYTESEVSHMMNSNKFITAYVKLKDRFGDNGLISVIIIKLTTQSVAEIDTWLMSCRVLKRGVEKLIFQYLIKELQSRNILLLYGRYIRGPKNEMVSSLLSSLGMEERDGKDKKEFIDFEFQIDSKLATELSNKNNSGIDVISNLEYQKKD